MAFVNAADFVLGNTDVCRSRPAPGATGSALGGGGAGGNGGPFARAVGSSPVADGSAADGTAAGDVADLPPLVKLSGRAGVCAAPPEQPASSTVTAVKPSPRLWTPVSRHLMTDEVPGIPTSCQLHPE
jgi:hypothetical protein